MVKKNNQILPLLQITNREELEGFVEVLANVTKLSVEGQEYTIMTRTKPKITPGDRSSTV
ncbi:MULTISPECIES: hypothetical protein [unclassified Nostoc]|uniref:hypothetical protein n=1 Tax=unclassified Nostoc TaxID=2593658 RepID=UPI00260A23C2|nr:hypothetical protein [Nostoc sp. S13]MDF5735075.1 hypothetical protein [Nostoc sp. S13]